MLCMCVCVRGLCTTILYCYSYYTVGQFRFHYKVSILPVYQKKKVIYNGSVRLGVQYALNSDLSVNKSFGVERKDGRMQSVELINSINFGFVLVICLVYISSPLSFFLYWVKFVCRRYVYCNISEIVCDAEKYSITKLVTSHCRSKNSEYFVEFISTNRVQTSTRWSFRLPVLAATLKIIIDRSFVTSSLRARTITKKSISAASVAGRMDSNTATKEAKCIRN